MYAMRELALEVSRCFHSSGRPERVRLPLTMADVHANPAIHDSSKRTTNPILFIFMPQS